MDRSKEDEMMRLIEAHFDVEPDIDLIVEMIGADGASGKDSIKLLEVNRSTTMDGIRPLRFAEDPANGLDYPSLIVEVQPAEFARIETGELPLPYGWRLGRRFDRAATVHGGRS